MTPGGRTLKTLDVVKRFEQMIESEGYVFLDSQEFETVVDYYLEINNPGKAQKAIDIGLSRFPWSGALTMQKAPIAVTGGET